MTSGLGKCSVCGGHASSMYPLLQGSPSFCSAHHNARDAGPYGVDFSGPDDFDYPDPWDYEPDYTIWTTQDGEEIYIEDMEDSHLLFAHRFVRRHHWEGEWETVLKSEITARGLEELPE